MCLGKIICSIVASMGSALVCGFFTAFLSNLAVTNADPKRDLHALWIYLICVCFNIISRWTTPGGNLQIISYLKRGDPPKVANCCKLRFLFYLVMLILSAPLALLQSHLSHETYIEDSIDPHVLLVVLDVVFFLIMPFVYVPTRQRVEVHVFDEGREVPNEAYQYYGSCHQAAILWSYRCCRKCCCRQEQLTDLENPVQ